jgi:hypothetical protein
LTMSVTSIIFTPRDRRRLPIMKCCMGYPDVARDARRSLAWNGAENPEKNNTSESFGGTICRQLVS